VFQVCDHINVLYLGNMVAQLEAKATNYDDVIGYITGTKTMGGIQHVGTTTIVAGGEA
jgi:D-xylose transport system ATP-binding protein